MSNFRNATTVIVCTALSLPGALLGLSAQAGLLDACSSSHLVFGAALGQGAQRLSGCNYARLWFFAGLVAYFVAWLAYFILTLTWVDGFKMPRWFAVIGTGAALFYYVPFVATAGWSGLVFLIFLPLVAPAMWLAVRAVSFHLRRELT